LEASAELIGADGSGPSRVVPIVGTSRWDGADPAVAVSDHLHHRLAVLAVWSGCSCSSANGDRAGNAAAPPSSPRCTVSSVGRGRAVLTGLRPWRPCRLAGRPAGGAQGCSVSSNNRTPSSSSGFSRPAHPGGLDSPVGALDGVGLVTGSRSLSRRLSGRRHEDRRLRDPDRVLMGPAGRTLHPHPKSTGGCEPRTTPTDSRGGAPARVSADRPRGAAAAARRSYDTSSSPT